MGPGQYPRYTDARKGRPWVAQIYHKRLQAANKTQTLAERVNVKSLCSTATHVSDQLVGVQKILHHGLSCCTSQQTHIGSELRRHLLSPPRRCAEHTSHHAQLLSSQRFLPVRSVMNLLVHSSRSTVLEKSRCCRTRIPAISDSEVFRDPQRYNDFYLIHPFLTFATICQTNQEIVNVNPNDTFQLTVIRVTTPQALASRHGSPSKLRKFLFDVQPPRKEC